MTLAATTPFNSFVGTGGASSFSFTFPVFSSSQLQAIVVDASGNPTTLVLGTDYTVSGLNAAGSPASTGSIALVNSGQAWLSSGNLATGYTLIIGFNGSFAQTYSIRNQGDFYRWFLEDALDYQAMVIQKLGAQALVLPPGINPSSFSPVLPTNLPENPGATLIVNAAGSGLSVGVPTASQIAVPVSTAQGGTGAAQTLTNNKIIVSSGSKIVEAIAITANRALTSNASGIPVAAPSGLTDTQLGYLLNLFSYRRPALTYVDSTHVDVELGIVTGGASDGTILFSDGQLRTEATLGLRRLNIGQVAVLTGAKQSGLRTGVVANNTWYACYAVKATDNATDWVLVADTVQPTQANYATLNSNFGTNSWAYLGMIRYGDQNATANAILSFIQIGNRTLFTNTNANNIAIGMNLADTGGATTLAYTAGTGTAGAVVPVNCPIAIYATFHATGGSGVSDCVNNAATHFYYSVIGTVAVYQRVEAAVSDGLKIRNGSAIAMDINLAGFVDSALGVGANPLI